MLSTAFSSGTSPICGVMSGVVTQKLKESRRGNTVSTGSRSNMVTISFLPRLACLEDRVRTGEDRVMTG